MTRTIFGSRGFRPGASTLGHGIDMGDRWTDLVKKYSQQYLDPTPQLKVTQSTVAVPEPMILGIPQKTAIIGGAVLLGIGILASVLS